MKIYSFYILRGLVAKIFFFKLFNFFGLFGCEQNYFFQILSEYINLTDNPAMLSVPESDVQMLAKTSSIILFVNNILLLWIHYRKIVSWQMLLLHTEEYYLWSRHILLLCMQEHKFGCFANVSRHTCSMIPRPFNDIFCYCAYGIVISVNISLLCTYYWKFCI